MPVTRTSTPAVQFSLVSNAAITLNSTQSYNLQLALSGATNRISTFLARTDRSAALTSLFGSAGTAATTFNTNVSNLLTVMSGTGLGLQVELRSAADMNGAAVAYAPSSPSGGPRIYLNVDLLSNGTSSDLISWLLLEAAGHNIDSRLNGLLDTAGDEGKAFAALLTGRTLTDSEMATYGRDPAGGVVMVNGVPVAVECEANKGPSASATALNGSFSEAAGLASQAAAVAVFSNANVSVGGANETWQRITALRFTVAGLRDGSAETVNIDGTSISLGAASSGITSTNGFSYSVAISNGVATINLSRSNGVSAAAVNALLNGLTYQNTNRDDPSAGTRTITLTSLTDSGGAVGGGTGVSNPNLSGNITVVAVNDGPTAAATSTNNTFSEAQGLATQAAAVAVFTGASVSTIEAGQSILGLGFSVSGLKDGNAETLTVDGTRISLGANSTGTTAGSISGSGLAYSVSVANGVASLSFSFSSATGLSASGASSLINGLSYQNTNLDNPSAGGRTITLTNLRDSGGTGNGGSDTTTPNLTSTITVLAVSDAPLLGSLAGVNLVDTAAQDSFTASTGSLSASDPEGSALSYGLNGASAVAASFDGVGYDLAASGSYGTLYLNSNSGQYRFQPRSDWNLNALSSSGSDSFNLSVSDGVNSTSSVLLVNFSGVQDAPEQYVVVDDGAPLLTLEAQALWEQALTNASRYLSELLSDPDRDAIFNDVFGRAGTDATLFQTNLQTLYNTLGGSGLRIDVDLRTDAELNGALAAYAAVGHTGTERLYVNGDKLNSGALDLTTTISALLEEFAHGMDQRLNGSTDSPGDEGELFATEVTCVTLTADQRALIDAEDDTSILTIESTLVYVEKKNSTASVTYTDTAGNDTFSGNIQATPNNINSVTGPSGTTVQSGTGTANTKSYTNYIVGTYGTLYANYGATDYTFSPNNAAINSATTSVTEVYSITNNKSKDVETYTVSITGVNDTPIVTAPSAITLTDTAAANTFSVSTGTLSATDAEGTSLTYGMTGSSVASLTSSASGSSVTYNLQKAGTYGTLYVESSTGKYIYVPKSDSTLNALTATNNGSDSFAVTAHDGSLTGSNTLTVNFTGANDTPIVTAPSAITLTDTAAANTFSVSTGTLSATDAEGTSLTYGMTGSSVASLTSSASGSSVTYNLQKAGTYGTLYVESSTGKYLFQPNSDSALNALSSSGSESFTVTASDGSATGSNTLTVNFTGANDTPIVTAPTSITLTDTAAANTFSVSTGTLSATDAEGTSLTYGMTGSSVASLTSSASGSSVTYNLQKAGTYGTLYVESSTGKYLFQPNSDSALNALSSSGSESFTVTASDGSATGSNTLTVNFTGANDTPIVTAPTSITLTDTAAANTFSVSTGTLSATDAEGTSLTYGMTGSSVASLTSSASGSSVTYNLQKAGTYGTLYVESSTGKYLFQPNSDSALNALSSSGSESFTVTASDGSATGSNTLTVNFTGANDTPIVTAPTSITLTDTAAANTFSVSTGTLSATDAEGTSLTYGMTGSSVASLTSSASGSSVTYNLQKAGTYGTLYVESSTGKYLFQPNSDSALNALSSSGSESFTVTASDGSATGSNTLTVNFTGANDTPIVTAPTSITLTDTAAANTFSVSTGTLSATDAEGTSLTYGMTGSSVASLTSSASGSSVTYNLQKAGTYGTLYVESSTGKYLFQPNSDSALNALSSSGSESFTVTASDGSATGSNTLTVNFTGANDSPVVTSAATASFAENGTGSVYTAVGFDPDAGTTLSYSISGGADAALFNIDSSTGAVTFKSSPNFESPTDSGANNVYDITVTASDGSLTASQAVAITVTNANEAPSITSAATASFAENGTGTAYTAVGSDPDSNTTLSYTLGGTDAAKFNINTSTGVVTFKTAPNFESPTDSGSNNVYDITVTASDGTLSSTAQAVAINVTDVNEFSVSSPTDSDAAANSVAENSSNGTTVGLTASASDADGTTNTVTYTLVGDAAGNTTYSAGEFAIGSTSGIVSVTGNINYEAGATRTLYVKATSADGSSAISSFTVDVTDVNEFNVSSPTDSDAATNTVAENSSNGTTVGLIASASDADGTTNTVTYTLVGDATGNTTYSAGEFAIGSTSGIVSVTGNINYEAGSTRTLYVKATSADGSSAISSFTVDVTDVNEFNVSSPTDSDAATNTVAENSSNGTTVGLIASASDADGTTNTVTYTLVGDATGTSSYSAGEFTIGSTSGIVSVAGNINYEAGSTRTLYVKATSADGSSAISSFTVNVTDVNEFNVSSPTDSDAATNTVAENSSNGTTVGLTASASDADGTTNTVTYTLVGDATGTSSYSAGEFTIGSTSGIVSVAGNINYEAGSTRTLYVKATSADGSSAISSFTVNVTDVNEFNVSSPTDSDAATNTVAENSSNGTTVGLTASASDADGTTNTVTYTLVGDAAGNTTYSAGEFAIGSTSGIVSVTGNINYEAGSTRTLYVKATSADGSSAISSFTVNVTDVNEFNVSSPTDSDAATNTVAENSSNGTTVGLTASASDADGTTNTVTYTLVGDATGTSSYSAGEFTIGSTSGIVSVAGNINYEAGSTRTLYVKATSADGSSAVSSFTVAVTDLDEIPPTATVDISDAALSDGDNSSLVTISFSEAVASFSNADLTVVGGTLSSVASTDGGITWTATFTADNNFTGTGSVTVTGDYTDLAGNTGLTGATGGVAVDTTNPTATVSIVDADLNDADNSSVVTVSFTEAVTGLSKSDFTVVGGSLGDLTSTDNITWSGTFTAFDNVETSGSVTLTGAYADLAGNTGVTGASDSVAIDTANPTLAINSPIAGDGFLNSSEDDSSLTISGSSTGADGRTVSVNVGGNAYTGTIAAGGGWSVLLTSAQLQGLSEGRINITANISDAAGNAATQATASFIVDRTPAAVPVIVASTISGTRATLVITAEAGTRLNIYSGSTLLSGSASNLVPSSGRYSFTTPELVNGNYSFTATSLDQAGNESTASSVVALTIAPPALPTVSFTDTGVSASDGITSNGVFSVGNISSGNSWQYSTNAGTTWINGSSTNSFTLLPGSYAIAALRVRQVDPSGKLGTSYSNPAAITVDVEAPAVALSAAKGSLGLVGYIAETTTLTFTFSEDPGNTFTADDITVSTGSISAISGSGLTRTATYTPPINFVGTATLTVASGRFTDLAGNINVDGGDTAPGITNTLTFALNTLQASEVPAVSISSSSSRLKIGQTATITFTFTDDPGESFIWDGSNGDVSVTGGTLSALSGTGLVRIATFTPTANSQFEASIGVGVGAFSVISKGSNTTATSLSLIVDTLAPPTVSSVAFSADSGSSSTDLITNDPNQTVTGTVSGILSNSPGYGDTVRVSIDNGSTWRLATLTSATIAGVEVERRGFSLGNVTLRGPSTILVVVEDEAGNTSSTFRQSYTYDAVTFTGELVLSGYGDDPLTTGVVETGNIDSTIRQASGSDNSFVLTLPNKEAGASEVFEISTDGGSTWSSTSSAQSTLADGTYRYRGTVTDTAGNTATSNVWSVLVDNTAPAVPTVELASAANDGVTNQELTSGSGVLRVSAEAEATLQLQFSSTATGSTGFTKSVVAGGSTQAVVLTTAETNLLRGTADPTGSYNVTINARAIDRAGNIGASASQVSFTYTPDPVVILGALSVVVPDNGDGSENGPTPSTFRISRTGDTAQTLTVTYAISSTTATAGVDYTHADSDYASNGYGTATIPAGQSYVDVVFPTLDNLTSNTSRQIRLTLNPTTGYSISLSDSFDTANIIDNDAAIIPEASVANITVVEGNSGSQIITFVVKLSQVTSANTSFNYQIRQGSATPAPALDSDYSVSGSTSGTATISAGASEFRVSLTVTGDTIVESDETIFLDLSSPTGLTFKGGASTLSATATIVNDDTATPTDPNAGITLTSSGNFSGTTKNDILTGDDGVNQIDALEGNDQLTGSLGADILSSRTGADQFIYRSFAESSLAFGTDTTDASFVNGDRIALPTRPTELWNVGTISATTLTGALAIAMTDKDALTSGNQQLTSGQAVMFTWGLTSRSQRIYLAAADSNSSDNTNDFLILTPSSINAIGSLSVQNYFA